MAISDPIQERITRSIYKAFEKKVIELGYLPDISTFPDTAQGDLDFLAAKEAIKQDKGFYIDVFSHSSARAKFEKECPRIVLFLSRVFEGEIGAPSSKMWQLDLTSSTYKAGIVPSQSSNLIFALHILSNKTNQDVLLTSILSNVTGGSRGFIEFYDEPGRRFFLKHTSYNDLQDPMENIIEKAYFYTVTDIWMADTIILPGSLKPIKEIKVEIKTDTGDVDILQVPEVKSEVEPPENDGFPYTLPFTLN